MDEAPLPSTTSKRPPPMTADFNTLLCSPKKILLSSNKMLASPLKGPESPSKPLDSPKSSLFRSPKSRFFDAGGASEVLSRNRPKQFFDNSALGTTPGTSSWRPPHTLPLESCSSAALIVKGCFLVCDVCVCLTEVSLVPDSAYSEIGNFCPVWQCERSLGVYWWKQGLMGGHWSFKRLELFALSSDLNSLEALIFCTLCQLKL